MLNECKILVSSNTNVAVDRILVGLRDLDFEELVRIGPIKKIDKQILPYTMKALSSGDEQVKELEEMMDAAANPVEQELLADTL